MDRAKGPEKKLGERSLHAATMEVQVKKVRPGATVPAYASDGAAGVDLVAALQEPLIVPPGERVLIPTGIAIALPSREWVALLFARSGLASKHGLALANGVGVIDADYRGEIMCAMANFGNNSVAVEPGMRVAQMVFMPIGVGRFVITDQLNETARGAGGFGSTGTKV